MSNNSSDNCVIVHYPSYAGGKFIQNCLALSRYSLITSTDTLSDIINNSTDYEYRINTILSTLPSKDNMKQWVSKYELGDREFYGNEFNLWQQGISTPYNDIIKNVLSSGLKFFVTAHSLNVVKNVLCMWKDATIISLVNYDKFQILAQGLKSDKVVLNNANESKRKYDLLKGNSWPTWNEFQYSGYNISKFSTVPNSIKKEISEFYPIFKNKQLIFDVDKCFLDKEYFIVAMEQLYTDLGFDDFNKELILTYWKKYTDLHE